jgi:hypothetical protein
MFPMPADLPGATLIPSKSHGYFASGIDEKCYGMDKAAITAGDAVVLNAKVVHLRPDPFGPAVLINSIRQVCVTGF